jgi:hypothetical protein
MRGFILLNYKTMSIAKRIEYICKKKPTESKLNGFEENKKYKGRTFNNLYEVSSEWASQKPTFLIEKKVFDEYFEIVNDNEFAILK